MPSAPRSWLGQLQSLRGEFRRSGFERALLVIYETILVCLGAWTLGAAWSFGAVWRESGAHDFDRPIILGLFGLAVIGAAVYMVRLNGISYRFESDGSVSTVPSRTH